MTTETSSLPDTRAFIEKWEASGAAERANYQIFLAELCDGLGVPRPDPTKQDEAENAYVFEKAVTFHHADGSTSAGRIDLYRRWCFVLEAKQGSEQEKKNGAALAAHASAVTPQQLAKTFSRAKVDRVTELLASVGQVREVEAGRFIF